MLALDRGEREGFLKVGIAVDAERAAAITVWMFARKKTGGASALLVEQAAKDAYARLIHPSLENELRAELTAAADEGAIAVFADNLRQLLLQPPIPGKVVMGLDPGYRMGCKIAVVDATGKVLDTGVVYPVPEFKRVDQAKAQVKAMILRHHVELLAIGNGTAGRETELFAAGVIRELSAEHGLHLQYMVVSEAGASVYSASKLAAEEFPQYDVNLRSAVSIARRLQDPLAELVKIDPKAIGVGQYQHDMPQKTPDRNAGRRGRGLRQLGRRRPQYSFCAASAPRGGHHGRHGQKHRRPARGGGGVHLPRAAEKGQGVGPQGV